MRVPSFLQQINAHTKGLPADWNGKARSEAASPLFRNKNERQEGHGVFKVNDKAHVGGHLLRLSGHRAIKCRLVFGRPYRRVSSVNSAARGELSARGQGFREGPGERDRRLRHDRRFGRPSQFRLCNFPAAGHGDKRVFRPQTTHAGKQ